MIVDNYTKEIQYISDEIYVTDKYALTVEDRNNDGISELYIDYFKDGKFTVDERGYNFGPPVATTVSNGALRVKTLNPTTMRKYIYFIALICCALSASTSYAMKKVIKTMMIAGQDGSHYWRGACEAMKRDLRETVECLRWISSLPRISGGDINTFKPDFAKYNLVVVNYGGEVWPEPVQKL